MTTAFTIPKQANGSLPMRRGFSLVELLVASMLSLLVMGSVAALFAEFGRSVSDGRSMSELNTRTRNAAWRLRQDLAGLTCVPAPRVRVEANEGYFHVINGMANAGPIVTAVNDVIALTTSSPSASFTGRLAGAKGFESSTAEVIWFCEKSGVTYKGEDLYNLHRRQLLVAPTPEAGSFVDNMFATKGDSDLSYGQHANSLGDLSKQATRFLTTAGANRKLTGTREGEDVILGNVVAFDVKVVPAGATAPVDQNFEAYDAGPPRDVGNPATQPLRGIEIRIRCLEPSSGQVRDLKVVHSFSSL